MSNLARPPMKKSMGDSLFGSLSVDRGASYDVTRTIRNIRIFERSSIIARSWTRSRIIRDSRLVSVGVARGFGAAAVVYDRDSAGHDATPWRSVASRKASF